jgi:hypothetical protein
MAQFLQRHSYRGRQPAPVLVDRLRLNNLAASDGTTAAKRRTALAQVEQLELLNRQMKDFDRALATMLRRHPDHELFLKFPRIADVVSRKARSASGGR